MIVGTQKLRIEGKAGGGGGGQSKMDVDYGPPLTLRHSARQRRTAQGRLADYCGHNSVAAGLPREPITG